MKYLLRTKWLYDWNGAKREERYPVDLYFLFMGDDELLHDMAFMRVIVSLEQWIQRPGSRKVVLSGFVESAVWEIYPSYLSQKDREDLTQLKFRGAVVVTYDEYSCRGKVLIDLTDEPPWVIEMLEGFTA